MGAPVLQSTWIKTLLVVLRLIHGCSRYQLFKLPISFTFMRHFSTIELLLHWDTGICIFLDVTFIQQKNFGVVVLYCMVCVN